MTFRVKRTSLDIGEKTAPCEGAFLEETVKHDYYTEYIWKIKINTIKDLMQLIEKTGKPVVVFGKDEKSGPEIEIYDDYRE